MTPDAPLHGDTAAPGEGGERVRVLLVSERDWFASALQAVLEPEGFSFTQARSGEKAMDVAVSKGPDLVIIDEGLSDLPTPELCRRLIRIPGQSSLPILVYSPNFWQESEQAEAMRAGAWDIIREPVRSVLLVAKLRRLLRIRELIESAEADALPDGVAGLFTFAGLVRMLPVLGGLAQRNQVPLSCAFFGPTQLTAGSTLERQRRCAARICMNLTRSSDVCARFGETDMVLVTYGAGASEASLIIRRLNEAGGRAEQDEEPVAPISAGIVELSPSEFLRARREDVSEERDAAAGQVVSDQLASLSRFAAAQAALRQAREAGGGIRIAEVA